MDWAWDSLRIVAPGENQLDPDRGSMCVPPGAPFPSRKAWNPAMSPLPHEFHDPQLLELALTHASTGKGADNERLEFLGDAALDLIVAEELYRVHPDLAEGDLTELKASVVSRRTLAEAAQKLELEARARVGRGLDRRALSRSVLANLYEAVLGAVYLDAGLQAAASFALTTLADPLRQVHETRAATVPKQVFQEHCQRHTGAPPRYEVVESRGKAHARAFLVRAVAGGETYPTAWGRTRKEAEHWAAQEALLTLAGQSRA